jgi:V/A-type H+-transporting ATPase subunit E
MTEQERVPAPEFQDMSEERLSALKNLLLTQAAEERNRILETETRETEAWLREEESRLVSMIDSIADDARKRAAEIRQRQVSTAEREREHDMLRLRNRLLAQTLEQMQQACSEFRNRPDYGDILFGLGKSALDSLPGSDAIRLRLAATDAALGPELAARLSDPGRGVTISFDPDPAPITGGLWLVAENGKRQSLADWSVVVQEHAELVAKRLMAIL